VNAGSAGIRVSGNFNVAAAHVANTANIQVQGTTTGVAVAASADVSGLTSASNAAGAAVSAAESSEPRQQAAQQPSIWIVEILGYGGPGEAAPQKKRHAGKNLSVSNPFPSRAASAAPEIRASAG
jgi:hypothetical protein